MHAEWRRAGVRLLLTGVFPLAVGAGAALAAEPYGESVVEHAAVSSTAGFDPISRSLPPSLPSPSDLDVEPLDLDPELGQRAQLRAKHAATLAAGLSGRIAELPLDIGDRVKRGGLVASFDCREEQARRQIAAAQLQAAEAKRKVSERLASLGSGSHLDVDLARAEGTMAAAQLRETEAVVDKCRIEAPFDGVVVQRPVRPLQHVAEGEPIVMLVDTDTLEVDMVLPSDWLVWLQPGVAFSFSVRETGMEIAGQVDRIVGAVDPVSQTVRVIGLLTAESDGLLPGMSGGVRLHRPAARVE